MKTGTQKHSPALRIPCRDWKPYTVDNIEEVIAFYLGVKTVSEPMKDILTEKANTEVDFPQPDLAIFSVTLEGKFIDISRVGVDMLGYAQKRKF